MSNPHLPSGATSSALTEYRKNRMIYANFLIQQQNQTGGYAASIDLETNGVAAGSIIPTLRTGALYTSVAERELILLTSANPLPSVAPQAAFITSYTQANESLILNFGDTPSGGSPILEYEYTLDTGLTFLNGRTVSSPLIITGLVNGTSYTVAIRAVNRNGPGPVSNSITGTPSSTVESFTTVGTTSWTAPSNIFSVEYLIVGGGGGSGGGYDTGAGGGGGGGMLLNGFLSVIPGMTYTVIVGDGGAGGVSIRSPVSETNGSSGENSIFESIIALGGGGGFASRLPSGGNNGTGGAAAIPTTTASLGGRGGGSTGGGGGGGGSSGAGGTKSGATAGTAGAGTSSSISGSSVTYGVGGVGGIGNTNNAGTAGTSNRGNGAKGGGATSGADEDGAKGGSGIIILKY